MILVVLLAAYGYVTFNKYQTAGAQPSAQQVGIANPASEHCVGLGGTLEIQESAEGQVGFCHIPDGRVCEEWALFRDGVCVSE